MDNLDYQSGPEIQFKDDKKNHYKASTLNGHLVHIQRVFRFGVASIEELNKYANSIGIRTNKPETKSIRMDGIVYALNQENDLLRASSPKSFSIPKKRFPQTLKLIERLGEEGVYVSGWELVGGNFATTSRDIFILNSEESENTPLDEYKFNNPVSKELAEDMNQVFEWC